MKNSVRIIGGKWRGKKIQFASLPGLRPTSDRIRETLFNWLRNDIIDATCLDCFAGSGALGFEATSRGANKVVLVDATQEVTAQLRKTALSLEGANIDVIKSTLPCSLNYPANSFDLVFLDPPFKQNMLSSCALWLEDSGLLKNNALIYIEAESDLDPLPIPNSWSIAKSKTAGQVNYYLCQRIA